MTARGRRHYPGAREGPVTRGAQEGGLRAEPVQNDAGVEALIGVARGQRRRRGPERGDLLARSEGGRESGQAITDRIDNDPDTEVKKRAVFALSQLPKDEGIPLLINVARTNSNPEVRKQAIFWLGQSKDARALAFFEEVLTRK